MDKSLPEIEAALLEIVRTEILETDEAFNADSNLFEAGLDSMATMQLLIKIEQQFGVQIAASQLTQENFSTIKDLAKMVAAGR